MTTIWNFPTRIRFGAGELNNLPQELQTLGAQSVLVVTDPGIVKAGLLGTLLSVLEPTGLKLATFDEVDPNPSEANVDAGAKALADSGANAIVALGGGSALDAAKVIAVRHAVDRPLEELDDAKGGDRFIPNSVLPIIAIPTTAGTGSEVGRSGVVTVKSTGIKTVIFSPALMPKCALLDPELTVSMPAHITAATGVDALTHSLEALVALGDHPMADGIAQKGIELVSRHLPTAVNNGADLNARGAMMKAAMMGAVAVQKGLGACHSLPHPLSSEHVLHHGLANALCLPAVMRFNLDVARDAYASVMHHFDVADVRQFPDRVAQFCHSLGIPKGLRETGVEEHHVARLSELAMLDSCHLGNPKKCDRAIFEQLFRESL